MYVAALRGMIEMRKEKNERIDQVKPMDLVEYMLARAKKEPLAFCILIELRFAEVIFLLYQSEKKSRHDLFIASMKFLLPFYTSSHAVKYVSMISDFLIDWFCSSDAEKIIFSKAILTRKTKNGSSIFSDRFVEWMMRDMRMWLGKHASTHHHNLVEQVAVSLDEMKKAKKVAAKQVPGANEKDNNPNIKMIEIDHIYCEVLVYCTDSNIWGQGPIKIQEKTTEKVDELRMRDFKSLKGVPLNTDLLFLVSQGTEIAEKYWKNFLVDGNWNDPSRPETKDGGVSLKRIDSTMAAGDEQDDLELARIEYLDPDDIKKAYLLDELKLELKDLNNELVKNNLPEENKRDTSVYKSWSKAAFAKSISNARIKLLDIDADFLKKKKMDIWEENDMRKMTKERQFSEDVDTELDNAFFSLKNTQASKSNRSFNLGQGRNNDTAIDRTTNNSSNTTSNDATIDLVGRGDEEETTATATSSHQENGARPTIYLDGDSSDDDMATGNQAAKSRISFGATKLKGSFDGSSLW
jgi:hypothetical protein